MPKIKTRKAAAKRLKVSGTGKIITRHARIGHLRRQKTKAGMRKLSRETPCAPADRQTLARQIPYG